LDSLLGANRAFSGVVIDPVPAGVRKSSDGDRNDSRQHSDDSDLEESSPPSSRQQQQQQQHCEAQQNWRSSPVKSRKSSLVHPRQPVIPLSSVKISADGNLADQLECLADRAEAELKKLMHQQEEIDRNADMEKETTSKLVRILPTEKR
jgi:hypothetical protein